MRWFCEWCMKEILLRAILTFFLIVLFAFTFTFTLTLVLMEPPNYEIIVTEKNHVIRVTEIILGISSCLAFFYFSYFIWTH